MTYSLWRTNPAGDHKFSAKIVHMSLDVGDSFSLSTQHMVTTRVEKLQSSAYPHILLLHHSHQFRSHCVLTQFISLCYNPFHEPHISIHSPTCWRQVMQANIYLEIHAHSPNYVKWLINYGWNESFRDKERQCVNFLYIRR